MNFNVAQRTESFQESVIRKMTRVCQQYQGINLAQGFPEKDPPEEVVKEALRAIQQGNNQYSITWGLPALREAVAGKVFRFAGLKADPEKEVTITCGSSEAIVASLMALVNPGEKVIVFEPFYENYLPGLTLCGGIPEFVRLRDPDWTLDPDELRKAFSQKPKAVILNTPANPSGKVFSRGEMETIARFCRENGAYVITDEIYSELTYEGERVSIAALPGMKERTILLHGFSKSWAMTGFRLGFACAPPELIEAMMKIHQYTMMCAPILSQKAAIEALEHGAEDIEEMRDEYRRRRNFMHAALNDMGLPCHLPKGAFYMFPHVGGYRLASKEFSLKLLNEENVACVPGSAFGPSGEGYIRCSFATDMEQIKEAMSRMARFVKRLRRRP